MITLIEALNYRSLRYVRQPLGPFHVLVGPNASGKSTFLDVVAFLGRLVSDGVEAAVSERTENFQDLVWGRKGESFQLAIEAALPDEVRRAVDGAEFVSVRYEVEVGVIDYWELNEQEVRVIREQVRLTPANSIESSPRLLFPENLGAPQTIIDRSADAFRWTTVSSTSISSLDPAGNQVDNSELKEKRRPPVRTVNRRRSKLATLSGDEMGFPQIAWLQTLLVEGIRPFNLNGEHLRRPSPPNKGTAFRPDGSNLPHVVAELARDRKRFKQWVAHLRTALPDLKTVKTILRQEDRHRYLMLEYESGLVVPSWMVSDGTLRMMALTLPAYLPDFEGVYLIEEPENGIHPRAVESVYQSLSSVYNAQILTASHSPVMLSCADAKSILCFAKAADGSTDVVRGDLHPQLQHWKGETSIGDLFAAGVLG